MKEVTIGDYCFCCCHSTVFEELSELEVIKLGISVFEGVENNKNTFCLKGRTMAASSHLDLTKLNTFEGEMTTLRCVTDVSINSVPAPLHSPTEFHRLDSLCLPRAFEKISHLDTDSEHSQLHSLTDRKELMGIPSIWKYSNQRFTIKSLEQFNALLDVTEEIKVENNCCNEPNVGTVDVSRFTRLELLQIGDNCFWNGTALRVVGLNALRKLVVGVNCFNGNGEDSGLVLRDCAKLQTVDLGYCSFYHFATCEMSGE